VEGKKKIGRGNGVATYSEEVERVFRRGKKKERIPPRLTGPSSKKREGENAPVYQSTSKEWERHVAR